MEYKIKPATVFWIIGAASISVGIGMISEPSLGIIVLGVFSLLTAVAYIATDTTL